jgi:hypothetical protein
MKNVKSTKTLMSFSGSSMNLSEMKKVQGGIIIRTTPGGKYCPRELSDDEREACMSR